MMRRQGLQSLLIGAVIVVVLGLGVWAQSVSLTITPYSDAVRFSAQGSVKELRVEILSLAGQKVFDSGPVLSNALDWKLLNTHGQPVANGVYLYTVIVKDQFGNVTKKLGKLAILRGRPAPVLSQLTVGELAEVEPLALPRGVSWREQLGRGQDNYRLQRRPGIRGPYQTLLQVEADGKLRVSELCLGAVIGDPMTGGDCRNVWPAGGGAPSGWTDDGTTVRLTDSTDRVGIGTSTPNEQLHITGNFRLPPTTATTGIIFSGPNRLIHTFGTDNFFAGVNAGNFTMHDGFGNVGVGASALSRNTFGCCNTAVGWNALFNNIGGANTAVGSDALKNNTFGDINTAVGGQALYSNIGGYLNTAVGWGADVSSGHLINATAIGANAVVNASNKVRIGDLNVTVIEGQVPFTSVSDKTKKENFLPLDRQAVLSKLMQISVTSWNYIGDDVKRRHYGPMAQDFFAQFGHDGIGVIGTETTLTSGDVDGILMVSVQALYELSLEKDKQIEQLTKEIEALRASDEQKTQEIAELKARLEALEQAIKELMKKQ